MSLLILHLLGPGHLSDLSFPERCNHRCRPPTSSPVSDTLIGTRPGMGSKLCSKIPAAPPVPDFQFFQLLSQQLDGVQLDWAKYCYSDAPGSATSMGICPTLWPKGICLEVIPHNPDTTDTTASSTYGQGTPVRFMGLLGNECGTRTFAEKVCSRGCSV